MKSLCRSFIGLSSCCTIQCNSSFESVSRIRVGQHDSISSRRSVGLGAARKKAREKQKSARFLFFRALFFEKRPNFLEEPGQMTPPQTPPDFIHSDVELHFCRTQWVGSISMRLLITEEPKHTQVFQTFLVVGLNSKSWQSRHSLES